MIGPNHHLVESGDQPHEDLSICKARGCGWTFRHKDRDVRVVASYRHIAEMIEKSKETT